ncbi:MAG: DegT/DnrJ/EryC1/StrS aminotransferase family protein [Bacteroidetes Order II. Incertae sedis bacterium]|nr:DegT/DnrJ/EryC1/StrS aminotransferase family protein [Bacteroidetes Order II. bacterium]
MDKIRTTPLAPWPHFDQDEINAVMRVLQSGKVNYWTGQECKQFEKEFAAYVGTQYAIAVANGTNTIELALHALRIPRGAEMILTSRTFMASASAAAIRGIKPVFADIDPITQNVTAETIRKVITPNTKVIMAVHLGGWPCPMDEIMGLAKEFNLKVIEDCAQAHGASYKGIKVGAWGHINSFSFCQDKIMTTGGEGGMITTDDKELWERAWAYKDHGKNYDTVYHKQHPPGFRWLHESFGTNMRMTEMQGAIGRIQLRKLDEWVAKRRANADILNRTFENIKGLKVTIPPSDVFHSYYKYYVFLDLSLLKNDWNRERIMQEVGALGIPCFSGSCSEIYLEKAFERCALQPLERLPVAKNLGETSLMFMVHPTMSKEEVEQTALALKIVMAQAVA